VRHVYAVIYQDCRGRYRSAGQFTEYLNEAQDGYDTLARLMTQPSCNGRIGTFGLCYAAHTQAALGCLDPPGLAAQFLDCGGSFNAYRSSIRRDDVFDLKQGPGPPAFQREPEFGRARGLDGLSAHCRKPLLR
jgi:uncharacterized protein